MLTLSTLDDLAKVEGDPNPEEFFNWGEVYAQKMGTRAHSNRSGAFHPSGIAYCGRRNVYGYRGEESRRQETEEGLEILRLGTKIHDIIQANLKEVVAALNQRGLLATFEAEVPMRTHNDILFESYGITGTCDGLLEIEKPGEWKQRGVVEIKSIKNENYLKLTGAREEHRVQANIYAFAMNAPLIYYVYYNKNTSSRRTFTEVFDAQLFNSTLTRVGTWLETMQKSELPPREESWLGCQYCPYSWTCQPEVLQMVNAVTASMSAKAAAQQVKEIGATLGKPHASLRPTTNDASKP